MNKLTWKTPPRSEEEIKELAKHELSDLGYTVKHTNYRENVFESDVAECEIRHPDEHMPGMSLHRQVDLDDRPWIAQVSVTTAEGLTMYYAVRNFLFHTLNECHKSIEKKNEKMMSIEKHMVTRGTPHGS